MAEFSGKVAFVTGAASGIGRATMQRLATEGASVYACDINAAMLEAEAGTLREQGLAVTWQALDVTDEAACRAAIETCVEQLGSLDILCNVAGMVMTRNFAELDSATWRRVMDVNSNAVFVLCHAAMPHLLASQGNIVNIASTAGLAGLPYNSAYCASKAAVVGLTKALAVEFASRGVRVNAICPGAVNTPLIRDLPLPEGADLQLYGRMSPLTPYFAEPEEIADALAYLASPRARFITGSTLVIDGGQTTV